MTKEQIRKTVLKELEKNDGILKMRPAWVTRDFLPPGKRLGLTEEEYDFGERGFVCERWLVSETHAANTIDVENEGISYLDIDGCDILLPDALDTCNEEILGEEYGSTHNCLGRLLKIYDYGKRLFYHLHQMEADAKTVGMNAKEEAYYFLEADLGPHPETFFGVHPSIVRENKQEEVFLPYLEKWEGEEILKYSRAYLNVVGEGFHLPAGILHAPGTALTLELQESSDVMAVYQADIEGTKIDKEHLYKHINPEQAKKGDRGTLDLIDWPLNADPYFYENHHISPQLIPGSENGGSREEWVWYNTTKFSGTRITVAPGEKFFIKSLGVHSLFVWKGKGSIEGIEVEGQKVSLEESKDELLVSHDKAVEGITIKNTGNEEMVIFKYFGPDINVDNIPYIEPYK